MYNPIELNDTGIGKVRRFSDPYSVFYVVVVILGFVLASWVGLRAPTVGTDTANYLVFYNDVVSCKCLPGQFEIGFEVVAYFFALFDSDSSVFLFSLSFLNFALVFWIAKKAARVNLSERESRKLFMVVLAAFLVSPFFLNAQINVIRHGMSALFLFLAVFDVRNSRFLVAVVWSLLSLSFHQTAVLSLLSLSILALGRRVVIFATIIMSISYISGASETIVIFVSGLTGFDLYGRVSEYAIGAEYKGGVRLGFAVFSIMIPVLIALFARFFCASYEYIGWAISIYLCLLMPFWFFGWANYSDRYAFTAWLFASVVLSIGLVPALNKLSVGVLVIPVLTSFFVFWYCLMSL